jgi:hypothetical protein
MFGMWQTTPDHQFRAVLEGYLVFLLPAATHKKNRGDWQIHFVLPEEERQKAYLAGEGFSYGTSLEKAQALALERARELRKKQKPPR